MTGFGFKELVTDRYQISVEIKSYNNRYLDILTYLPGIAGPLEPTIREKISKGVQRGRVEVSIKLRELQEDLSIRVNEAAVSGYYQALKKVREICNLQDSISLRDMTGYEDIFRQEKNRDLDDLWKSVEPALDSAFSDFLESRKREGEKTLEDLLNQLTVLEKGLGAIQDRSVDLESHLKESLMHKMEEYLPQVDDNRVLAEVAVLLMRYGINEELTRLHSHLGQFREILGKQGSMGKKLDFLCQEIGREINTIGSKTTMAEVQHVVVEMKDSLENTREQLRNVE